MAYIVDTKELRKAMIEKDMLKIDDLSKATGVNRNTISEVVNGKIYPSSTVMGKIGTALDFSEKDMGKVFFKLISDNSKKAKEDL